jgi:hypothetical protein
MLPNFLLPETTARGGGTGPVIDLEPADKVLIVTLGINRIVEQESLDVSLEGSADGQSWKTLMRFPQKFYCGTYSMLLDLSQTPDVRQLRVEYKTNRWGRGEPQPLFGFYVFAEEASKPVASLAVA